MTTNPSSTDISEPDWRLIFDDLADINLAMDRWRVITVELRERGVLEASNQPLIARLVVVYALYDRASREVASKGAVIRPRKGNSKAIPRVNPHFTAMSKLSAEATALESELGISPASRKSVSRAERKANRARAADRFLRVVK